MPAAPVQIALLTCAALINAAPLCAGVTDTKLNVSIKPRLLSPQPRNEKFEESPDSRLKSGLELALQNKLLAVSVDYNFQGLLNEQGVVYENSASQVVDASLHSSILDRLLGLNTNVKAHSLVQSGGDSYRYRISPGFSRSLHNIARVELKYQYSLARASARAVEQQQRGYSLGLKGSLQDGRLTWSGTYNASSIYADRVLLTQSSEGVGFRSSYRLIPDMQLNLSSAIKHQTLFSGTGSDAFADTRYGAGLSWSPSALYSVAFKVNRVDDSRASEQEILRSGTVSWFPRRDIKLSVNYGDQLVAGGRGVMISTRLELDRS